MNRILLCVAISGASFVVAPYAGAAVLFNNGPLITGTSTTGVTAGEPISAPQLYPGLSTATVGTSVKSYKGAEDFVLNQSANLDTFTFYAFQSQSSTLAGTKIPTVTAATVNLWNTTPVTGGSPMYAAVTVPVLSSTFVGWRESTVPGGTVGQRPVFAYTVSLDSLGGDATLAAGTYWIEWVVTNTSASNVFTPLVTPREQAFNTNFRLFGPLSGSNQWFETWESGSPSFPSPEAAPFLINGTLVPEPVGLASLTLGGLALAARKRR